MTNRQKIPETMYLQNPGSPELLLTTLIAYLYELVYMLLVINPNVTSNSEMGYLLTSVLSLLSTGVLLFGVLLWLCSKVISLCKVPIFSGRSSKFKFPHHAALISIWVSAIIQNFLIRFFLDNYHDHRMISFSLAAIFTVLFSVIVFILFTVSARYEFRLQLFSGTTSKPGAIDFILNPYVLSAALVLILVGYNFDWLKLVLPIPLILELIFVGLLLFLFHHCHWKWSSGRLMKLFAIFIQLALSILFIFTLKYSQDVRRYIDKSGLISSHVLSMVHSISNIEEFPQIAAIEPKQESFDFDRFLNEKLGSFTPSTTVEQAQQLAEHSDVFIISIDSLRADHLSCYGYPAPTSPALDSVAKESVLFLWNFIQGGDSPHSISSMLSGVYPEKYNQKTTPLLKDYLKRAGFKTIYVGFNSIFQGEAFSRGHDRQVMLDRAYSDVWYSRTSEAMVDAAISEVQKTSEGRCFLYMHLLDPHAVHLENEFTSRFEATDEALYNGEIAYTDSMLERFFNFLKASGRWESAVIVITADHGDEFEDHGDEWHGKSLYNESIRTPLIMKLPGISTRKIEIPSESVDIVPTLLSLLNIQKDKSVEGTDLLPLIYENVITRPWVAYSMIPVTDYRKYAVIMTPWKLIYNEVQATYEMYDYIQNPSETINQFDQFPVIAQLMKEQLKARYPIDDAGSTASLELFVEEARDVSISQTGGYAVSDFKNAKILVFDKNDHFRCQFGTQGPEMYSLFDPSGVFWGKDLIFIADLGNHRIQGINPQGEWKWTSRHAFTYPFDVVENNGNIWVTDIGAGQVVVLKPDGSLDKVIEGSGTEMGRFHRPAGIAQNDSGEIHIADSGNQRIQVFNGAGLFLRQIPVSGWQQDALCFPFICFDDEDRMYVSDPPAHRILVMNGMTGEVIVEFPVNEEDKVLKYPMGLDYDNDREMLYVVDTGSHQIRRIEKARIFDSAQKTSN